MRHSNSIVLDSNLFVIPIVVITDMFLFIDHPCLDFTHDVLQAKETIKKRTNIQTNFTGILKK